jgi:hypothetical protein
MNEVKEKIFIGYSTTNGTRKDIEIKVFKNSLKEFQESFSGLDNNRFCFCEISIRTK